MKKENTVWVISRKKGSIIAEKAKISHSFSILGENFFGITILESNEEIYGIHTRRVFHLNDKKALSLKTWPY